MTASVALAAAIFIELYHASTSALGWNGMEAMGDAVSYFMFAVWLLAVAGIWSPRAWMKVFPVIAVVLTLAYGALIALGGTGSVAAEFVAVAVVTGVTAALARREETRPSQDEPENYREAG
jgi:hypothetical protein